MSNPLALIVEDEYDLSIIFSEAVQAAGFKTEIVRAGDVAIERLKAITPNIVVLDLLLPQIKGSDILQHIRAVPRLKEVPVIIVTAHPRMADTLRDDAHLVLVKPVSFIQLRDLTAHFL